MRAPGVRSGVLRAASAAALVAVLLPGPAAAAAVPMGKARTVAAKRLFGYVYPLSYVTGYDLTGCARESGHVTCEYRVTFYGGAECTGTITVESVGRAPVTLLKAAGPCNGSGLPTPTAPPASGGGTTSPPLTPPVTPPVTPPGTTPPPTTTPPAGGGGGYKGTGPSAGHWIVTLSSDGMSVTLDDGSNWTIAESGRAAATTWLPNDAVIITAVSGSTYTIRNDDAGTAPVTATYLGGDS